MNIILSIIKSVFTFLHAIDAFFSLILSEEVELRYVLGAEWMKRDFWEVSYVWMKEGTNRHL